MPQTTCGIRLTGSTPAQQALPPQEQGTRPARAVPYELHVHGETNDSHATVELRFRNTGDAAAVLSSFLVSATAKTPLAATRSSPNHGSLGSIPASSGNVYDLSVLGPNGFLRTFAGSLVTRSANLSVRVSYENQRRTSTWKFATTVPASEKSA